MTRTSGNGLPIGAGDKRYLKLDQTTPQTTVGTFTFPLVGVGTTSPGYNLGVSTAIANGSYNGLRVIDQNYNAASHAAIDFYNSAISYNASIARIYTELGTSAINPKLFIDVADASKTLTNRLVIDKAGLVGIGTTNPTHKLDVVGSGKFSVNILTPEIKTDITTPTDLTIVTGAAKTLVLSTPVYNDLYTSVVSAKTPAVGYPDWSTFTTNTGAYTFKVNDYADLSTIEVLHDYKEGTNLEVHLHLATNGTNNATERKVKYMVYYTWANPDTGSNQFSAESSVTAELTIPANQPDKSAYFLSLGTIAGATMKIGAQVKFRVKRIAGTGTEPINDPFLGMVGIHYQIDTMGSRSVSAK